MSIDSGSNKFENIEKKEEKNETSPLSVACIRGKESILEIFLQRSSSNLTPKLIDKLGNLAEKHEQFHVTEHLKNYLLIKSTEEDDDPMYNQVFSSMDFNNIDINKLQRQLSQNGFSSNVVDDNYDVDDDSDSDDNDHENDVDEVDEDDENFGNLISVGEDGGIAPETPQTNWVQNAIAGLLNLSDGSETMILESEARKIQRAFRRFLMLKKLSSKNQSRRSSLHRGASMESIIAESISILPHSHSNHSLPIPPYSPEAHTKALKIQRAFRNYKNRKEHAAVIIQSLFRAHRQRKLFHRQYTSLVAIQLLWKNKRAGTI